jgi:hypothetical protein
MQHQSQGTVGRAAAVASNSAVTRNIEATRLRSEAAAAERARYVEPGLARLLGQVPQSTGARSRLK